MDHALVAIKRLCRADRIAFTIKAEIELERDDLDEEDVVEAILNADSIEKRLRSLNPRTGLRETLYVIESANWDGVLIYTKGKIVRESDGDRFYILISSKRSEP
jgi:hypothetical protein